jgi:hypothetical protein
MGGIESSMQCQLFIAAMPITAAVMFLALVVMCVRGRWLMVWLHGNEVQGSAALIAKFVPVTASVCSRSTTGRRFALGLGRRRRGLRSTGTEEFEAQELSITG